MAILTGRAALWRALPWAVAAVLCARPSAAQPPDASLERNVKAAFLYNFTRFVQWPAAAFEEPEDPVHVCVVADAGFERAIDEVLANERVSGRPLTRLSPREVEATRGCQVLFVARSAQSRAAAILASARTRPVLTVGDADDFLQRGGIIGFVIEDGRVRFDVDLARARANGLTISSRLLQVARRVVEAPEREP
jgi:hypothetical protein